MPRFTELDEARAQRARPDIAVRAPRRRRPARPPTAKQLEYLRALCDRAGLPFEPPATREDARSQIRRRLAAKRRRAS